MLELHAVFQLLTDFGLHINPLKCEFGALSMEFLRHLINNDGIAPLPEKVAAMRSYDMPQTAKELRRYLSMINFYRRFVPKPAETLQHLYDLIKELNSQPKNARIIWNSEQLQAFKKSKTDLANASYLAYWAPDEPLYLAADSSDTSVAVVLYQKSAAIGMRWLFTNEPGCIMKKCSLMKCDLNAYWYPETDSTNVISDCTCGTDCNTSQAEKWLLYV